MKEGEKRKGMVRSMWRRRGVASGGGGQKGGESC